MDLGKDDARKDRLRTSIPLHLEKYESDKNIVPIAAFLWDQLRTYWVCSGTKGGNWFYFTSTGAWHATKAGGAKGCLDMMMNYFTTAEFQEAWSMYVDDKTQGWRDLPPSEVRAALLNKRKKII